MGLSWAPYESEDMPGLITLSFIHLIHCSLVTVTYILIQAISAELLQVLFDMDTPLSTLDAVRDAVGAHMALNPGEFGPESLSSAINSMGNPLKMNLAIYFDYSHNGEPCRMQRSTTLPDAFTRTVVQMRQSMQ